MALSERVKRGSPIEFLLLVGAASLIYYKKITQEGLLTWDSITYRSDFVFGAVVLLAVGSMMLRISLGRLVRFSRREVLAYLFLAAYLLFSLVATALSATLHGLYFDTTGLVNLAKTVLGILVFVVAYRCLRPDPIFYRRLALALLIPPLIPAGLGIVSLAFPEFYGRIFGGMSLLSDGVRFQGLTSNPWQAAISGLVAIAFLYPLLVYAVRRRQRGRSLLGLLSVGCLMFTVYWSLNRAALLGLVVTLVLGCFLMMRHTQAARGAALVVFVLLLAVAVVAWLVLPSGIQAMYLERLAIVEAPAADIDRLQIWTYYAGVAVAHPLGVGFNYEQVFYFDTPFQGKLNAQNDILAAWMYGGIPAVLSVLVLLWYVALIVRKELKSADEGNPGLGYYIGAVTGFATTWALYTFVGIPLPEFVHALLLAMVVAGVPGLRAAGLARQKSISGEVVTRARQLRSPA